MIHRQFGVLFLTFFCFNVYSQSKENVFLKLVSPAKESLAFSATKKFITGLTCKTCTVAVNGNPVQVYNTGAFAFELKLALADTTVQLIATAMSGKQITKIISYTYVASAVSKPVILPAIESIQTFPAGNLTLRSGDRIQFRVKALPGASVSTYNNTPLFELPLTLTDSIRGIYQGEYEIRTADNFSNMKFAISLATDSGQKIIRETTYRFSVLSPLASDIAITRGRLAHLKYGLGQDRLGGAKIGYLDSLVPLKIIGKVGSDYKIQLAKNKIAYIEEEYVTLAPKGTFTPSALTGTWRVFGDSAFDYVQVAMSARLPYQSTHSLQPSRIVVDVFGAISNTNWITQLESAKEISQVHYEQVGDDIFRITIQLKNEQHWGHQIYYRGNTLNIKIKQQPKNLALSNLVIAVDAGHGGNNTGAQGITGAIEKDLTLAVSLKLKTLLLQQGAKVVMTRDTERFFDNQDRILFYRDSLPDLLVSIHLNSATDPIHAGGTMMFYRHPGFRPLNEAIYKRMKELPLKPGGVTSSFNFMLNSPTEYPNALVETLFLSNPEEEARIVDPTFQQQIAEKIVAGIKDFLTNISINKK